MFRSKHGLLKEKMMRFDRWKPLTRAAAMLGMTALLAACGNGIKIYPVRGEVFAKGKPAKGAVVHFHPRGKDPNPPAFATVTEDGSFRLTTFHDHDGAAAGDYTVTVSWRDEKQKDGETVYSPDRFRDRFSRADKSTLKATVQPGNNEVPRFDLK
jgi:hypothetical protein